ncbi:hypothetical protein JG687_00002307 [Phytophthora cactorum]|uniref:Uncharacterized protein n=1 Tax=Phytophthora cactorum TaxID=29920 RepID=A0A8T1UVP7_9STRA|nr:hypothetical protein JG687_00002307 [Phytophthora cactorum]
MAATWGADGAGHFAGLIDYALYQPNPLQQIFYLLLAVGGYSAFLFSGLPHLPNDSLSEIHIYLSFVAVLGALHSFIAASMSSPGILLPQTLVYFDNYELDDVLYRNREYLLAPSTAPFATSASRASITMNVLLCGYGSYVLFAILSEEYRHLLGEQFLNEDTRTVVQGEPMVVVRYLIHAEAVVTVLFVLCVGMGFALVCFFGFHLYLVSSNLTTNEFFKLAPGSYAPEQVITSFGIQARRPLFSSFATSEKRNLNENKTTSAITPVPAIPQRQQSYGYVQVGVELQRQSAPEKIYSGVGYDTVGPAAYSRHNSIWNEKKNGAPSLKSTAKREVWEENKRLTSLPGPGQYNTNSGSETTVVTAPKMTPEGQQPRIGARRSQHRGTRQSAVFASKVPILQAPKPVGVYDPEREQELLAKEERAERYRQEQNTFGGYGVKTEAFGSTTGRTDVWGGEEFTPGPGAYSDSGSFDTKNYLNSAAFKSGSTRFAKNAPPHAPPHVHCVGDQATPAVGQYNVSKGFSDVASSVQRPLEGSSASDAAEFLSPRVPFMSTQERSVFDTRDVCDLPGPGAYKDSADDAGVYTRSRDVRLTVGNEARFRVKPTVPETVGPGAYAIPGTVGTKSFNVTMTPKDKGKPGPTRARGSPIHKTYAR